MSRFYDALVWPTTINRTDVLVNAAWSTVLYIIIFSQLAVQPAGSCTPSLIYSTANIPAAHLDAQGWLPCVGAFWPYPTAQRACLAIRSGNLGVPGECRFTKHHGLWKADIMKWVIGMIRWSYLNIAEIFGRRV